MRQNDLVVELPLDKDRQNQFMIHSKDTGKTQRYIIDQ